MDAAGASGFDRVMQRLRSATRPRADSAVAALPAASLPQLTAG